MFALFAPLTVYVIFLSSHAVFVVNFVFPVIVYIPQVLLHEPNEKPLMLERSFKVSPGFLTQVSVSTRFVSTLVAIDCTFV